MKNKKSSRFLSLILRHDPEAGNITLDKNGWAPVKDILSSTSLTLEELEELVRTNDKQRFEFNPDHTKIKARQGHSVDVDVELKEFIPTSALFHGTSKKSVNSIMSKGITKMDRLHVHLSNDITTAKKVGGRHGEPVILMVDAVAMHEDGYNFFISNNQILLTDYVPVKYLYLIGEVSL